MLQPHYLIPVSVLPDRRHKSSFVADGLRRDDDRTPLVAKTQTQTYFPSKAAKKKLAIAPAFAFAFQGWRAGDGMSSRQAPPLTLAYCTSSAIPTCKKHTCSSRSEFSFISTSKSFPTILDQESETEQNIARGFTPNDKPSKRQAPQTTSAALKIIVQHSSCQRQAPLAVANVRSTRS